MSSVEGPVAWHVLAVDGVLERLSTDVAGLTDAEVEARRLRYGPNALRPAHHVSPWGILAAQFKNVLIVVLLVATALSFGLGHAVEAAAILAIVLFAVGLGFFQEYRADRAMEALQEMAAPTATVVRAGVEREILARDLVPGDVVLLHAGDRVPADARLVDVADLQVDEAPLTGESVPVEKETGPLADGGLPVGDRRNMLHAGTAVTYGRGRAVVVETGPRTEFGRIAELLRTVGVGRTPLQENLDRVGRVLVRAALAVVAVIVGLGLVRGQPFLEMFIFGVALAVAVVPEALPAVVTISLAIGVQRMVRRQALVRRLPAVETLGSTSVICTDKTGTLTKDEMTVRRLFVAGRMWDVSGVGYEPRGGFSIEGTAADPSARVLDLLRAAALASDAHVLRDEAGARWHVKGDPTEGALVAAAAKAGLEKPALDARYPRVDEIPFSSEAKRMTTLHDVDGAVVAYAKGAPECILERCRDAATERGNVDLDAAQRAAVLDAARRMAGEALRVLAVGMRRGATRSDADRDMTFLGLVGMIDPARPEARPAIEQCERAGVRVVMITGDHPATAQAVARELGLLRTGRVVAGPELEAMEEEELVRAADDIAVYARVSPAHKLRVVSALQAGRHVVAMTGDGVNDAPALKKADIGIAMGITGTDVSKEAADMTLLDDNFASIVAAVEEGRGIFDNIKKYLMYLLSSNVGEICLIAGTSLVGLPLPLTAVQILYVNLATDGLPALALSVDPPDAGLMTRPPRAPGVGIFTRPVVALMTIGGLWSAAVNLGLFAWSLHSGRTYEHAMTMTFASLVLIQFFKAYNFRSDRESILRRPFANRWLNLAVGWECVLLALIVHVPILRVPFRTHALSPVDWAIVAGLALTISPVLEVTKWAERRGWFGKLV